MKRREVLKLLGGLVAALATGRQTKASVGPSAKVALLPTVRSPVVEIARKFYPWMWDDATVISAEAGKVIVPAVAGFDKLTNQVCFEPLTFEPMAWDGNSGLAFNYDHEHNILVFWSYETLLKKRYIIG